MCSPGATDGAAKELASQFPAQTFEEGGLGYKAIQASYWSGNQKDLKPRLFFQPHTAEDLARGIAICTKANCYFGVKSGGHGHFAGQSCLDGGIQFDLVKLNKISLSEDKKTVTVGPGCTWGAVYDTLQKDGLIAVGGRSAGVGVGGFLVGGGISFFAARLGWGVDHVRSFEVILGNGSVVTASPDSEPNLFQALQGGGSNLGIITAFELDVIPYRGMWGGRRVIEGIHAKHAIAAYADFIPKLDDDPKGHTIIIFTYGAGPLVVIQYLAYTEPIMDLPMFDNLRKVPAIQTSLGLTHYTTLAEDIAELQHGHGDRQAVSTLTVKLDKDLLDFVFDTFVKEASTISEFAKGTMEYHALPRAFDPPNNLYGIGKEDGPLISLMIAFSTTDERYDDEVIATQQCLLRKIRAEAEKRNLYHPFLFANYAGRFQDVVGSYGSKSAQFLSEMARVYDPEQVFQQLQQGTFKVNDPVQTRL